jgi:hypothetical protein
LGIEMVVNRSEETAEPVKDDPAKMAAYPLTQMG